MRPRALGFTVLALAIAGSASAQSLDSIQSGAAAACDKAYATKKIKEKARAIRMPMALLDWNDATSAWAFVKPTDAAVARFNETRGPKTVSVSDLRPFDAAEVHSVACVKRSAPIQMGTYPGNEPAMGYQVSFRIVSWPDGKPLADWAWEAKPPPQKPSNGSAHATTGPDDLAVWIGWIFDARVTP